MTHRIEGKCMDEACKGNANGTGSTEDATHRLTTWNVYGEDRRDYFMCEPCATFHVTNPWYSGKCTGYQCSNDGCFGVATEWTGIDSMCQACQDAIPSRTQNCLTCGNVKWITGDWDVTVAYCTDCVEAAKLPEPMPARTAHDVIMVLDAQLGETEDKIIALTDALRESYWHMGTYPAESPLWEAECARYADMVQERAALKVQADALDRAMIEIAAAL